MKIPCINFLELQEQRHPKLKQISREEERRRQRKYIYGLTHEAYTELLYLQKGLCAICKDEQTRGKLGVDHCHKTKKVRGLLCMKCNHGIGNFNDSLELLELAKQYLQHADIEGKTP